MLSSGFLRLGEPSKISNIAILALSFLVFISISYSKFTYLTDVSLNNSIGTYKIFEKVGPIYVDEINNDVYVIDQGNRRLMIVSNNTVKKYLLGESNTILLNPNGIDFFNNKIYIANGENLLEFDLNSMSSKQLRLLSNFENLVDVKIYNNSIYSLDRKNGRIIVNTFNGDHLLDFGSSGFFDGQMLNPSAIDVIDDKIYVADTGNKRIDVFSLNGTFLKSFGRAEPGKLEMPVDIKVTNEYVFVADKSMQRVIVYNRTSMNFLDVLYDYGDNISEFFFPSYLHVEEGKRRLYVADQGRNVIRVYSYDIDAEKPITLVEKGNKTLAEIKIREANKSVEELLALNDLAKKYGLNFVLSSKEFLDFSYRLYNIFNYDDSASNAIQALLKAAEEKGAILKRIKELQVNKRDQLNSIYFSLSTRISDSELSFSTKSYLDCEEQLVNLINSNKIFEVHEKLNECESVLKKLDEDFKKEYETKSSYLKTLVDSYKNRYQAIVSEGQNYNIQIDTSTAFYLLSRFSEKTLQGKLIQAENFGIATKKELEELQYQIDKERKRREGIAEKIKMLNDQASEISKDFPEVYNQCAVEFSNLVINSLKNPEESLQRAQILLNKVSEEVKIKSEERQKAFIFGFLVILTLISIFIAFYVKNMHKKH
ncbi:MAG: hypothetical protein QXF76_03420 [Candidatus Anstonellales archaeon]